MYSSYVLGNCDHNAPPGCLAFKHWDSNSNKIKPKHNDSLVYKIIADFKGPNDIQKIRDKHIDGEYLFMGILPEGYICYDSENDNLVAIKVAGSAIIYTSENCCNEVVPGDYLIYDFKETTRENSNIKEISIKKYEFGKSDWLCVFGRVLETSSALPGYINIEIIHPWLKSPPITVGLDRDERFLSLTGDLTFQNLKKVIDSYDKHDVLKSQIKDKIKELEELIKGIDKKDGFEAYWKWIAK